ncbi:MAG: glycosyltransferase family 4 protein [Armatimonadota bacterium]|nr:glycosyltransferase family 4 protein [Armatimonadota bacterium]MDR7544997.1 glycosyltransferase family 4 protein [Armatimonadota bacterium]
MARILLFNQYFPPDSAATARVAAFVAGTLAERHQVTVLAGRPSYDPAERHPAYLLRRERGDGVVVERVGSTAFPRRRMAWRLVNYLTYLALAVPRALMLRADLVLAMTDPPVTGIAGALVAAVRRRRFVYNVQDLYPDMAVAGGLLHPGPWTAVWDRLHRWALRRADRVIVLGDDMRDRLVAKGVTPERIAVVRDGGPPPAAVPANRDHPVVRAVRGPYRFVVLHAGNVGFAGAWQTLTRAAALLDGAGAGLVFVGDGAAATTIDRAAEALPHVRRLPFRPASEVPYVLAAADLHVVTVRRGLDGVVVPSKLYAVLAAGRPVLAVAPESSDVVRIVRQHGCGFVADPDDPVAVAAAVRQAMASPDLLETMGRRALTAAADFEQSVQLARFVEVVEEVLASPTSRRGWPEGRGR